MRLSHPAKQFDQTVGRFETRPAVSQVRSGFGKFICLLSNTNRGECTRNCKN
jgi:hypothetical protein